ncbi:MAG: hydrogenase maturation nickel metallochaperone HypA [Gammaproteobacteria bacterium]|nr:hydrogenase maturation nickel metallochaperone HypA [Gammaproteobacteria bacterium]
MHELSICQALVDQLEGIAAQHPGKQVADVYLGIGPLSGVVPQLLSDAFSVARAGSCASTATLHIHESEIIVRCLSCGKQSPAKANRLLCSHCGEWRTDLVSGDELLLERVELEAFEQPGKTSPAYH